MVKYFTVNEGDCGSSPLRPFGGVVAMARRWLWEPEAARSIRVSLTRLVPRTKWTSHLPVTQEKAVSRIVGTANFWGDSLKKALWKQGRRDEVSIPQTPPLTFVGGM